jgi:hypothetical protein
MKFLRFKTTIIKMPGYYLQIGHINPAIGIPLLNNKGIS